MFASLLSHIYSRQRPVSEKKAPSMPKHGKGVKTRYHLTFNAEISASSRPVTGPAVQTYQENPFCLPVPKPRSVCAVPNRLSAGERFSLGAPAGVLFFFTAFFPIIRANAEFVKTGFLFFCRCSLVFSDSAVQNPNLLC